MQCTHTKNATDAKTESVVSCVSCVFRFLIASRVSVALRHLRVLRTTGWKLHVCLGYE